MEGIWKQQCSTKQLNSMATEVGNYSRGIDKYFIAMTKS